MRSIHSWRWPGLHRPRAERLRDPRAEHLRDALLFLNGAHTDAAAALLDNVRRLLLKGGGAPPPPGGAWLRPGDCQARALDLVEALRAEVAPR